MTLDEKRSEVIEFYKSSYKDSDKLPIQIHSSQLRDPKEIEIHWQNMKKMKRAMVEFYEKNSGLHRNLSYLRGLKPTEDPVQKRGPFD